MNPPIQKTRAIKHYEKEALDYFLFCLNDYCRQKGLEPLLSVGDRSISLDDPILENRITASGSQIVQEVVGNLLSSTTVNVKLVNISLKPFKIAVVTDKIYEEGRKERKHRTDIFLQEVFGISEETVPQQLFFSWPTVYEPKKGFFRRLLNLPPTAEEQKKVNRSHGLRSKIKNKIQRSVEEYVDNILENINEKYDRVEHEIPKGTDVLTIPKPVEIEFSAKADHL